MDRELWGIVMRAVRKATRAVGDPGRRTPVYPHRLIVAMYLWSVWHDRCLSWACDRSHYGAPFRPRGPLPSVSQFTRRVKGPVCQAILQHVHGQLAGLGVAGSPTGYFDGKALLVGPVSKDPEAARGRVSGGFAKGYKLHAYVNERRRVVVWGVMPLNVAEQSVALELVPRLPPAAPGALDLADSNYDSAPLHKALAPLGRALLTPLKGQGRVKDGAHHPVTLRQMGAQRREAVAAWRDHPDLVRHALKARNNVEGTFSVMAVALGLGTTLPAFVRRLDRVRRWVGGKILLYHARLLAQERAAANAAA
jgi:hypothetical protein